MVNLFVRFLGTNDEGKRYCKAWLHTTCDESNIQDGSIVAIERVASFTQLVNLYIRYQPCTIHIHNIDNGEELCWNWASVESRAIKTVFKAIINQIDYWNNERLEHESGTKEYNVATEYYNHWMHILYEAMKYDDIAGEQVL